MLNWRNNVSITILRRTNQLIQSKNALIAQAGKNVWMKRKTAENAKTNFNEMRLFRKDDSTAIEFRFDNRYVFVFSLLIFCKLIEKARRIWEVATETRRKKQMLLVVRTKIYANKMKWQNPYFKDKTCMHRNDRWKCLLGKVTFGMVTLGRIYSGKLFNKS